MAAECVCIQFDGEAILGLQCDGRPQPRFPEFNLQSRCHLSENKWEAEGRMGWKDKGEACGGTVRLSQKGGEKTVRDGDADGRTEECHGWGKVPPVIERRDSEWQCERACDKSNSWPAGGGQLVIQRAAIETARRSRRRKRDGGRVGEKEGWPGEKPKRREIRSNGNEFSETQRFESKWEKQSAALSQMSSSHS